MIYKFLKLLKRLWFRHKKKKLIIKNGNYQYKKWPDIPGFDEDKIRKTYSL